MGTKYTTTASSGYNASPPADDGSATEANKTKWSTVKTKLTDVLKTFTESVNTKLVTHFDLGPDAKTAAYTILSSDYQKTIECDGTFSVTLGAAASLGAGFFVHIKNTGTGTITIDGNGAETIDGAATQALAQNDSATVQVDSTSSEWIIVQQTDAVVNDLVPGALASLNSVTASEIDAGAVGTSELAAGAVTAAKIANATITTSQIAINTITSGNIGANAVGSSEIVANAVTASEIAANAVGSSELADYPWGGEDFKDAIAGSYEEYTLGTVLSTGALNVDVYSRESYMFRDGTVTVKWSKIVTDTNPTVTWGVQKNGADVSSGTQGNATGTGSVNVSVSVGDVVRLRLRATHAASTSSGAAINIGVYSGNPVTPNSTLL